MEMSGLSWVTLQSGAFAVAPRIELAVFLLVGLLGGAHCLGMCGPLVSVYAERMDSGSGSSGADSASTNADAGGMDVTLYAVRQQLLFNLGRTATYALLGGVMGALGAVVVDAAAVASAANSVRAATGVLVGLLVVAVGVEYARGDATSGVLGVLERGRFGSLFGRLTSTLTNRVDRWVDTPAIAVLGAVHGFLPCPLLYPAYLYALARGDPVGSALALGTLGLGTIPTLLVYGTLFDSMDARRRARLHRALGVAFVVLGYLPLSHGLVLLGVPVPLPPIHEFVYNPVDAIVNAAEYCLPA